MLLRPQRHVCLLGTYQEIPFEYKDPVIGLREPYDPHARSASLVKPEVRYILVDPQIRRTHGVRWRFDTMGADVRGKTCHCDLRAVLADAASAEAGEPHGRYLSHPYRGGQLDVAGVTVESEYCKSAFVGAGRRVVRPEKAAGC